jgi:hypothetical protein
MTDTQDRIVKGCKFIANIASQRWESDQTGRALERLAGLINNELFERTGRSGAKNIDVSTLPDEATPEFAEKLFTNPTV